MTWRTDTENAPADTLILIATPTIDSITRKFVEWYVVAGRFDGETGELKTVEGDDAGWSSREDYQIWQMIEEPPSGWNHDKTTTPV